MRIRTLAAISLALGAPLAARAYVVVRVRPVVVVPVAPVYVVPAPVYVAPAPAPAPKVPAPLTEKVPVNTTMWTLPSGCTPVTASGTNYFVCGPNWLRAVPSDKGTYYAVVAPP
jgi:hypothetical protein